MTIFARVEELIEAHAPDAVALEESFVGVDARTALSVGQARGAVLVASARAGADCTEYSPAMVKKAVCGHGRAEKGQMQRMVKAILALDALPTPHHAADALAVAICHALAPPLLEGGVVIARLRGIPAGRTQDGLVLDVGGVGYLVQATPRALARAEGAGEITVDTYLHVREDALQLYGFADVAERRALRAAAQRLRCRTEGRARDRVGLDACRASPCDRARRHRPIRGDPGHRTQDGAACRPRAQGLLGLDEEAVEDGDTHVVARDALVELGYSLVDAESILSNDRSALAARGASASGAAAGRMSATRLVVAGGRGGGRGGARPLASAAHARRVRRPGTPARAARDCARGGAGER